MDFQRKASYDINDLLRIMEILRSPEGCPWDREQTHQSIRKNFIEEVYEAVEAIDLNDGALLKEELGDILLQVVFHSQMESEAGTFDFSDVSDAVCKKLITRHPHIFSGTEAKTSEEVLKNWEDIKNQEKGVKNSSETLFSVPKTLPSLMRGQKLQHRAAKAGMDFPDLQSAFDCVESEASELRAAIAQGDCAHIEDELGDLLFSVVNVARFLDLDAENALEKACDKFISRFAGVEGLAQERGIDMQTAGIDLLDILWGEVKNMEP